MANKTSKKKESTLKVPSELREALQDAAKTLMKTEPQILTEAVLKYLKKKFSKERFQRILAKFSQNPAHTRGKRRLDTMKGQITIKDSFYDPMDLVSFPSKRKNKPKT